jgi:3-oxoacyl-[acyl-carrier-protein] synthase III
MVLARGTGFARLLSLTTIVDTSLEGLYRGGQPFGVMAGERGTPVDNRARRHTHVEGSGYDSVVERTTAGLLDAVDGALADAGTKRTEIARYVFPSVGVTSLRTRYLEPLGLDLAATTWEWGRRTGHVGASDQLLGLHHLVETGAARPGERVMLVGIGAGFSWSCAVVEIDSLPVWDGARRA